ncbi:hypothetical protein [Owenweeksia hongkongensis]|uniref:hypothetical protein n=1 Tax=Owenweeksia hongkongensis TaxID=253245 RepID=UPI003A903878
MKMLLWLNMVFCICAVGQSNRDTGRSFENEQFRFELVSLDKAIESSIDSIVSFRNECEVSDLFWYLNFEKKGDTVVYILSLSNIERLVEFIGVRGIDKSAWKATMVNNRVVIIVDSFRVLPTGKGCYLEIQNPKRVDRNEISFRDYSSWVFAIIESKPYLVVRSQFRCN